MNDYWVWQPWLPESLIPKSWQTPPGIGMGGSGLAPGLFYFEAISICSQSPWTRILMQSHRGKTGCPLIFINYANCLFRRIRTKSAKPVPIDLFGSRSNGRFAELSWLSLVWANWPYKIGYLSSKFSRSSELGVLYLSSAETYLSVRPLFNLLSSRRWSCVFNK